MNQPETEKFSFDWIPFPIGSVPFQVAESAHAWLEEFPFEIAFRPQFPLAERGDMLEELNSPPNPLWVPRRARALKNQIAGPYTVRRLSPVPEVYEAAFLAHLEVLSVSEMPRIFCLDEPCLAISMGEREPQKAISEIRRYLEAIKLRGALPALHCCFGNDFPPLLQALLSEVTVPFLSLPYNEVSSHIFRERLSAGERCCLGFSEEALITPEKSLEGLSLLVKEAGLSLHEAGRICMISSECGLGLKTPERGKEIFSALFHLSALLRMA